MRSTGIIAVVAACWLSTSAGGADEALPFLDDHSFAPMHTPGILLPADHVASVDVSDEIPPTQPAWAPQTLEPFMEQPFAVPPDAAPVPGCCEVCEGCSECCCDVDYRSGWTFAVDGSALQSHMASRDVDAWPDEFGAAGRISAGYEAESGLGFRMQAWGYSMIGRSFRDYAYQLVSYEQWFMVDVDSAYSFYLFAPITGVYAQELHLSAATIYLDFYKNLSRGSGELLLGGGPAFGNLDFSFSPQGRGSQYYGGGVTLFGQGAYPFIRRRRWELAFFGRARVSLLTGDWDVDAPSMDTAHSNSMSILELGIGPEIRRRFGRSANHYWFLRALAEYQQWQSDRMGPMAGDTLALQGATISIGANW